MVAENRLEVCLKWTVELRTPNWPRASEVGTSPAGLGSQLRIPFFNVACRLTPACRVLQSRLEVGGEKNCYERFVCRSLGHVLRDEGRSSPHPSLLPLSQFLSLLSLLSRSSSLVF